MEGIRREVRYEDSYKEKGNLGPITRITGETEVIILEKIGRGSFRKFPMGRAKIRGCTRVLFSVFFFFFSFFSHVRDSIM